MKGRRNLEMKHGRLTEDPTGLHVTMVYKGRELLGTVADFCAPKRPELYSYLYVVHFNGEPWPVDPLAWEVTVLVPEYETESTNE